MASIRYEAKLVATCVATAATGAPVAGTNKGIASVADNGAGDHAFTLNEGIDAAECLVVIDKRDAAAAGGRMMSCVHTSDTVKQIITVGAGGAAADPSANYRVAFFRLGLN